MTTFKTPFDLMQGAGGDGGADDAPEPAEEVMDAAETSAQGSSEPPSMPGANGGSETPAPSEESPSATTTKARRTAGGRATPQKQQGRSRSAEIRRHQRNGERAVATLKEVIELISAVISAVEDAGENGQAPAVHGTTLKGIGEKLVTALRLALDSNGELVRLKEAEQRERIAAAVTQASTQLPPERVRALADLVSHGPLSLDTLLEAVLETKKAQTVDAGNGDR